MLRYGGLAQVIKKEEQRRTASPGGPSLCRTRGVERLNIPEGIPNSELWKGYIIPKSRELKKAGKRLLGTPRVLPDGVILEWVLDYEFAEDAMSDQLIQWDGSDKITPKRRWQSLPVNMEIHLPGSGQPDDPILLDDEGRTPESDASTSHGTLRGENATSVTGHGRQPSISDRIEKLMPDNNTQATDFRTATSDSEGEEVESDTSDGEALEVGPSRHNPSLAGSELENYGAHLLAAGELSRKALSELEREGKLPSRDMPVLPSLISSTRSPLMLQKKSEVAGTSHNASGRGQGIRPQKARTLSGKRSCRVSNSSDEEIPSKRARVRQTHVIHSSEGSDEDPESSDDSMPVQPQHLRPSIRKRLLSESPSGSSDSETSDSASSSDLAQSQYIQERLASESGLVTRLPKPNHARARRLLLPSDSKLPITCVYMRADVQFLSRRHWLRMRAYSLPCEETRLVTDACLVNDRIAVLGYNAGPANSKVSLVPVDEEKPRRIDILHSGYGKVNENNSSGLARPSRGITALCALKSDRMQFLSGGQDRSIRLWTLKAAEGGYIGQSREVAASYSTEVQAIAFRTYDDLLFSGGNSRILYTTHLPSGYVQQRDKLSNPLVQVHVNSTNESLVFLEVDHLNSQIALYDTRKAGFSRRPCLDFGYREPDNNLNKRSGRFFHKGSVEGHYYARGYSDGSVCVWDLRKVDKAILKLARKHEKAAVHTVLCGDVVMAYGDISVSCWNICSGGSRQRR